MRRQSFAAGNIIFSEGDHANFTYLIVSGAVDILRYGFSAVLREGELFGEAALLDRARSATARARTDCVLLALSRDELIDAIRNDPDQAISIINAIFNRLAEVTDQVVEMRKERERESVQA